MVHPGGLLALRLALRAVAKATLSFLVPAVNSATSSISSLLKISENMVHPGGFEPPTARFVAEYSIQLSYGCIGKFILLLILIPLLKPYQVRDGASGRITRLAARPLVSSRCLRRGRDISSLLYSIGPHTNRGCDTSLIISERTENSSVI